MEWIKEERYRRLEETDPEEISGLAARVARCPWRQGYHIQPKTGLLNDPNGFAFFQGEYHLFYQWFPLGPVHGLKYWYHTSSPDLVHWTNRGVALRPDRNFDSHGVYSGSAIEHDGRLYLMYTGNTRDDNWERLPYQCMAQMEKDGSIHKFQSPVIGGPPSGYTDHYRDPKVWHQDGFFYAVIGAQRSNLTGCAVLYRSIDLHKWELLGELRTGLPDFGYMWECPDYFELAGQGILCFCPQGARLDEPGNIYPAGYLIGEPLDVETRDFRHGDFRLLDRGFDFYAPQTTLTPDGRRILVGWMGLPDVPYPTDDHGWAHCLTLPRELRVEGGRLYQLPARELQALRGKESFSIGKISDGTYSPPGFSGSRYELLIEFNNVDAFEFGVGLRTGEGERTVLVCDSRDSRLMLDRTLSGRPIAAEYGMVRSCAVNPSAVKLQLFVDTSSVEVFVDDGREVFTARIFPDADSMGLSIFAKGGEVSYRASKWDITSGAIRDREQSGS
ncbi:glycoside hydrolase family 32 protein [Paenibacillus rhizophilus]|uniref:Sucrose-6-phosphate hydrolase n=1 Tax=Paenibacillus rhizophilus TaxID=1850366 RepID=A0A3N9P964_9BACL|nr:sucrose-6-phosphate hydrolase [Paenibacillus rhizophilus]RQW12751.1 sucrose-6-phosphate hydrolase [Paenibacillus rhizophilus]